MNQEQHRYFITSLFFTSLSLVKLCKLFREKKTFKLCHILDLCLFIYSYFFLLLSFLFCSRELKINVMLSSG